MGKNNRERRAQKKRQRDRGNGGRAHHGPGPAAGWPGGADPPFGASAGPNTGGSGAHHGGPPFGSHDEQALHELAVGTTATFFWGLIAGGGHRARSDAARYEVPRYHDELRGPERAAVARRITSWFTDFLGAAWEDGWLPSDQHAVVRRELGDHHARLMAWAIVATAATTLDRDRMPARWADDLATVADDVGAAQPGGPPWLTAFAASEQCSGADAWTSAIEVLRLSARLRALGELCPPPSRWTIAGAGAGGARAARHEAGLDQKLLDRVRALLAKAESTSFTEEADAFTAKAQDLMARHAIDVAMIDIGDPVADPEPEARRFWIQNPYPEGKSLLLDRVAHANRCRAVFASAHGVTTVFGFPADLATVDILFTSLLVQASAAILSYGPQTDRSGRSRTRSFRASFWISYSARIGERLDEAARATVGEASAAHGTDLLPMLVSREERVDAATAAAFPHATARRSSASNAAGWAAGRLEADRAQLASGAVDRRAN